MKLTVRRILNCALLTGIGLVVAGAGEIARAQETRSAESGLEANPVNEIETDNDSRTEKPAPVQPKSASPGTTLLRGADGKPIAVPNELTDQDHLDLFRIRNGPRYAVNSIEIEGDADQTRARLTATIKIQVLDELGWVTVPLGLNEAVLRGNTRYEFLARHPRTPDKKNSGGEEAFHKRTAADGMIWWFKGYGEHKLTLSLLVPVTKQTAHRRLKLTIPPRTAASRLKLQVPIESSLLSVTRAKEIDPDDITGKGRNSVIKVDGLGDQLDLQWRELPPQRKAGKMLNAKAYMLLTLSESATVLIAEQQITASNDVSFKSVEMRLPEGFEVSEVSGAHYNKHLPPDASNRTVVHLSEPRTDTRLIWTLRRKQKLSGGKLKLSGFEVDRARFQLSEIAIAQVQGLQVSLQEKKGQLVDRIPVSDFHGRRDLIRAARLSKVYETRQAKFELDLSVSRIKPDIRVSPKLALKLGKELVELEARFVVKVGEKGGTVEEMLIDWPNRDAEQWESVTIDARGLVESVVMTGKDKRGPIRVKFSKRQNGEFVLPLTAVRKIPADGTPFLISLPTLRAETSGGTTVTISHNADQSFLLQETNDETSFAEQRRGDANSLERVFHVEQQPTSSIWLTVSTHDQQIATTTALLAGINGNRLQVEQKIGYRVSYKQLAEVRFKVPTVLDKSVRFFGADGRPMKPVDPGLERLNETEYTFRLPTPRTGQFEWIARYEIELDEAATASEKLDVRLPIVRSSDAEFTDAQFEMQSSNSYRATVDGDEWRLTNFLNRQPRWTTETVSESIPLTLTPTKIPRTDGFSIPRAFLFSAVESSGLIRTRAKYRIDAQPARIVIVIPRNVLATGFWWGRHRVEPQNADDTSDDSTVYLLELPKSVAAADRWLTVDFQNRDVAGFRWYGRHDISVPRFPANVWVEKTVWRVTFPANHHLFSNPPGYVPRFEWARGMFFWSRQRKNSGGTEAAGFTALDGPAPPREFPQGNTYEFGCYGPAGTMSIDSMNRSLIVLFGAGIAWIAGILMVRLPVMRSVVAVLSFALALAVAGVWYLVEVQVLLQPAILGLLLAGLLVWIERRVKRPAPESAVLTISQPSDLLNSDSRSSESSARSAPFAGSEDVTAVRPALVSYRDSNSGSDVKSQL